jgi:transcriptional regulator with XRE-family HTH domain
MNTKTTDSLHTRLNAAPLGSAAQLTIAFLLDISARQQALGLGNAELARRMGTTPAYITRLYQTSANLSLHTMARLASAVGGTVQVGVDSAAPAELT